VTAPVPHGLISRVADCCMWLGRYVERSESTARELQTTHNLALDGELGTRQCWHPVVVVAGEEAGFRERFGDAAFDDGEQVQRYLVWDEACTVSLRRSVAAARENARSIRDVLSAEPWEALNELHLWLGGAPCQLEWQSQRDAFYRRVRQSTQLCLGLLRSTMLHDTALDFMWLGVLLERVGQTARLLDVHYHTFAEAGRAHQVLQTAVWMSLLRACSGFEPFMRAHAGRVTGATVARFLFGEARFPRSIAYCVHSAYDRLCAIRPPSDDHLPGGEALSRLGELDRWVKGLPPIAADDLTLHEKLTHVVDQIAAVCDTIGRELLGYGQVQVQESRTTES
jgi:uncharacterized alpha-E superfamily protein